MIQFVYCFCLRKSFFNLSITSEMQTDKNTSYGMNLHCDSYHGSLCDFFYFKLGIQSRIMQADWVTSPLHWVADCKDFWKDSDCGAGAELQVPHQSPVPPHTHHRRF